MWTDTGSASYESHAQPTNVIRQPLVCGGRLLDEQAAESYDTAEEAEDFQAVGIGAGETLNPIR